MFIYKQVKEMIIDNLEKLYPFIRTGDQPNLQYFFRKQAFVGLQTLMDGSGVSQKELLHTAVSYGILASLSNPQFLAECDLIIVSNGPEDLVFNEEDAGFLSFEDAIFLIVGSLDALASNSSYPKNIELAFLSVCAKLESTIAHQLLNIDYNETQSEFDSSEDSEFLDAMLEDEFESNLYIFNLTRQLDKSTFQTRPMEKYKEVDDYCFYRSRDGVLIVKKIDDATSLGYLIEDIDDIDVNLENFIDEDTYSGRCPIVFNLLVEA